MITAPEDKVVANESKVNEILILLLLVSAIVGKDKQI
jgi:hypothetical protein